MDELVKRIHTILNVLDKERYTNTFQINELKMKTIGYNQRNVIFEDANGWETFPGGSHWGGKDTHCCFKVNVTIPEEFSGKVAAVRLQTGATDIWDTDNPQFMVYVDGVMVCAMDMNHQEIILTENAMAGQSYEIGFYSYSNSESPSIVMNISVFVLQKEVEQLYYDIKVPLEAVSLLRDDSIKKIQMVQILAETVNCLDLRKLGSEDFYQSVKMAEQFIQEKFYREMCSPQEVTVHSIGHTHIDVAWKWPLRQTREKAIRSFKTVLYLMEYYPEYKFMSSQPQLYEFVKEDCPEVYEQIKKRVAEGRWETEGAMWLEADCNLVSGESLVRQILYGKDFFKKEFGKGKDLVLWLPDVFGYSAALPQIMKKSGIKYFMTTKIAWNEYNQIPNDVMLWKGIDGTEILTYFISTTNYEKYPELNQKPNFSTTYNGRQNVNQIMGTWQRFKNKEILQDVLTCYGFGDGGGGPTSMMLEESRRLEKGIPGSPVAKQTFVKDFFELIEKKLDGVDIPKWCGELYLEFHRGTYTSMARNKRYNRLCEFLNSDAELFSLMDIALGGKNSYPEQELHKMWKLTLLNQFHDILPGSSIEEVYEDSKVQYEEILDVSVQIMERSFENMIRSMSLTGEKKTSVLIVWNQLGFNRDSIIKIPMSEILRKCPHWKGSIDEIELIDNNKPLAIQKTMDNCLICFVKGIPMKGYKTLQIREKINVDSKEKLTKESASIINQEGNSITLLENQIETPFYHMELNKSGELISIYDKEMDRELVQPGKTANQLLVFEDRPYEYDAWNIDSTYTEKYWEVSDIQSLTVTENGPVRTCIHVVRKFLDSVIEQNIILYPNHKRIDFQTTVDWKESQLLLKTAFPMDIVTDKAIYEIQYGNVERPTHRNTSWEKAKFEVCAHKWADLAEDGYGVALMNDCKYGYDIHGSVMRLTLIKSGIFPNPNADKEIHHFTYAILPHSGDFRSGRVIQEAYDLNCPVYTKAVSEEQGLAAGQDWSMLKIDQENVILEVVKKAEDNEDMIIRMYEAYGKRSKVKIDLSFLKVKEAYECDLMEQILVEKAYQYKDFELNFKIMPYEIKTFRLCK